MSSPSFGHPTSTLHSRAAFVPIAAFRERPTTSVVDRRANLSHPITRPWKPAYMDAHETMPSPMNFFSDRIGAWFAPR